MKIYVKDINNIDLNKLLNKYIKTTTYFSLIFSLDGIYKKFKDNDIIFSLKFIDNDIKLITLDKWSLLIDTSVILENEIISQIPYNFNILNFIEYIFILRENTHIKLVVITDEKNKINDFYFYYDEKLEIDFKNEILTFLLEIN